MTGPESLSLAEVAQILTAETGRSVRYRPETIEEVNSSREGYGAPGWQVDASVTTYTAIAVGEVAEVTDDVPRLSGHPATSLAELLRRGASVRAGDHAPHIAGAVGDRLRDVLRSASGHVVLTIAAPDGTAPVAESDGAVRVLVADDSDQAAGFDAVVADPGRSVAFAVRAAARWPGGDPSGRLPRPGRWARRRRRGVLQQHRRPIGERGPPVLLIDTLC